MSRIQTPFTQGQVSGGQTPNIPTPRVRLVDFSPIGEGIQQMAGNIKRFEAKAKAEADRLADELARAEFQALVDEAQMEIETKPPSDLDALDAFSSGFTDKMNALKGRLLQSHPDLSDRIEGYFNRGMSQATTRFVIPRTGEIIESQTRVMDEQFTSDTISNVRNFQFRYQADGTLDPSVLQNFQLLMSDVDAQLETSRDVLGDAYVDGRQRAASDNLALAFVNRAIESGITSENFGVVDTVLDSVQDETRRTTIKSRFDRYKQSAASMRLGKSVNANDNLTRTRATAFIQGEPLAQYGPGGELTLDANRNPITTSSLDATAIVADMKTQHGLQTPLYAPAGETAKPFSDFVGPALASVEEVLTATPDNQALSSVQEDRLVRSLSLLKALGKEVGDRTPAIRTLSDNVEARLEAHRTLQESGETGARELMAVPWDTLGAEGRREMLTGQSTAAREKWAEMMIDQGRLVDLLRWSEDIPPLAATKQLRRLAEGSPAELEQLLSLGPDRLRTIANSFGPDEKSQEGVAYRPVYEALLMAAEASSDSEKQETLRLIVQSKPGRIAATEANNAFFGKTGIHARTRGALLTGTDLDSGTPLSQASPAMQRTAMYLGGSVAVPAMDIEGNKPSVIGRDIKAGDQIPFQVIDQFAGPISRSLTLRAAQMRHEDPSRSQQDINTSAAAEIGMNLARNNHFVQTRLEGSRISELDDYKFNVEDEVTQLVPFSLFSRDESRQLETVMSVSNGAVDDSYGALKGQLGDHAGWLVSDDSTLISALSRSHVVRENGQITAVYVPIVDSDTSRAVGVVKIERRDGVLQSAPKSGGIRGAMSLDAAKAEVPDADFTGSIGTSSASRQRPLNGTFDYRPSFIDADGKANPGPHEGMSNRLSEHPEGSEYYRRAVEQIKVNAGRSLNESQVSNLARRILVNGGWNAASVDEVIISVMQEEMGQ